MVSGAGQDSISPVHLLKQEHSGQFVGKGHGSQGKAKVGIAQDPLVQSVCPADNKAGSFPGVKKTAQKVGELPGSTAFAVFIKTDKNFAAPTHLEQAVGFLYFLHGWFKPGIPLFDDAFPQNQPAGQPRGVVFGGGLPKGLFQAANGHEVDAFHV
jgi:hypothetical protein